MYQNEAITYRASDWEKSAILHPGARAQHLPQLLRFSHHPVVTMRVRMSRCVKFLPMRSSLYQAFIAERAFEKVWLRTVTDRRTFYLPLVGWVRTELKG
jgi:hypothetical protein